MSDNLYESISKKRIIVDVIVKLMDEEGMKKVTVKDICDKANISIGSFYHYFNSKDTIVEDMYQVMDEYFVSNKDNISHNFTAEEDIIAFVTHFGLFVEQWGYYANLLIIRSSIEDATKNINRKNRKIYNVLKEIIQTGIDEKHFVSTIDSEDLASTIFITIRAYFLEWTKKSQNYPVKENMIRHVKWLLSSLC